MLNLLTHFWRIAQMISFGSSSPTAIPAFSYTPSMTPDRLDHLMAKMPSIPQEPKSPKEPVA